MTSDPTEEGVEPQLGRTSHEIVVDTDSDLAIGGNWGEKRKENDRLIVTLYWM